MTASGKLRCMSPGTVRRCQRYAGYSGSELASTTRQRIRPSHKPRLAPPSLREPGHRRWVVPAITEVRASRKSNGQDLSATGSTLAAG
jgi:hypothetical protein